MESYENKAGESPIEQNPLLKGFSLEEEMTIKHLRDNGFENNPDYLEFVKAREAEIEAITDPAARAIEIARFDIRKALIIGAAGDTDYALELLEGLAQNVIPEIEDELRSAIDYFYE